MKSVYLTSQEKMHLILRFVVYETCHVRGWSSVVFALDITVIFLLTVESREQSTSSFKYLLSYKTWHSSFQRPELSSFVANSASFPLWNLHHFKAQNISHSCCLSLKIVSLRRCSISAILIFAYFWSWNSRLVRWLWVVTIAKNPWTPRSLEMGAVSVTPFLVAPCNLWAHSCPECRLRSGVKGWAPALEQSIGSVGLGFPMSTYVFLSPSICPGLGTGNIAARVIECKQDGGKPQTVCVAVTWLVCACFGRWVWAGDVYAKVLWCVCAVPS